MTTSNSFFELSLAEQKDIIQSLHWEQLKSISEVAKILGTYNNKIRRWAQRNSVNLRDKSEAQKVCLSTGKMEHPTKGKKRTAQEKLKIGNTVAEKWENISEKERKRRSKLASENWKNKDKTEIEDMQKKATKARLLAAKEGSKLEKLVLEALINAGFKVECHKEHILLNEKVHFDLWVPDLRTVIEIDGPTHFLPIWGEDHLKKTQKTDRTKDGLILNSGFCIIRVQQRKNLSKTYVGKLTSELIESLNNIQSKYPEPGQRKITIGENYA